VVGIYDLGGGTVDAAVLAHGASGFELLGAAEGIERLGGIDFDQAVLAHVSGFLGGELDGLDMNDPATLAGLARLRADCVEAKEALSADTDVSIPVMLPQVQTEIRLTRVEFEAMIRPTLAETTASLARAFRSAGVAPDAVKAVLLVGGSSRIPLVGQLVAAEVGRPVAVDVHPKHVVALGAALAAAGWNGEPGSARIAARSGADGAAAVAVVPALAAQPIAVTALPPGAPSAPAPPDEPPAPAASAPSAAAPSAPAPAPSAPAPSATTPAPSTPVPPTAPIAPADPTAGTYRTGRPPPPSDGSGAAEPPPPVTAPTGPTGPTAPKGGKGTPTRRRLLLIALLAGIVVIAVAVAVVVSQGSGHKTPVRTVTAPASSTTSLVTTGSIAVPGTQAWTDTGIDLKSGQHVIITATGTIEHNNIDPASTVGPDGDPRLELRQYNVLINGVIMAANHGALIAKIGDGDPFLVGQTLDLVVASSGRLSLGVNDAGVANNAGAFQASIKVTGA
jgi:hypothetical protein